MNPINAAKAETENRILTSVFIAPKPEWGRATCSWSLSERAVLLTLSERFMYFPTNPPKAPITIPIVKNRVPDLEFSESKITTVHKKKNPKKTDETRSTTNRVNESINITLLKFK